MSGGVVQGVSIEWENGIDEILELAMQLLEENGIGFN